MRLCRLLQKSNYQLFRKQYNMKNILWLLFFINFINSFGQEFEFAVVNDTDGFVNVRNSNEIKSNNITDKLENGFVVTHFGAEGNWVLVDYKKNGKDLNGYIYKDRIKALNEYTKIPNIKTYKSYITISNEKIKINIFEKSFDKTSHILKYYKENPKQLYKIDGKEFFGTDGNIPKKEYDFIEVEIDSKKIILPKQAIENLYEPNLEYTTANYNEETKTLYIYALNGDGAGGYAILWIIENGKYKMRIETNPF